MSSLTHLIPPSPSTLQAPHRLLTPTTNSIPLLSSPLAKRYTLIQTLLIPTYYYLRAPSLVSNPFNTLLQDLGVVATLQALFCALCLPRAGAWMSGTGGGAILEGSASSTASRPKNVTGGSVRRKNPAGGGKSVTKAGAGGDGTLGERVMPTLFSLVLAFTLPPLPLTLLSLLLGAPLYPTTFLPLTLLLSLHVSLLAFLPLFYTHGVSASAWRDISAAWLPFDKAGVWGGTIGTFLGGWVGAIPMALDWDRDWQAWPCTVVWGVVIGWAVGRLLTGVLGVGVGKRIDLSEKEEPEIVLAETEARTSREKKLD